MLHLLPSQIGLLRPQRFTYPFCYDPHPLALLAVDEVVNCFRSHGLSERQKGKMIGVLVVEDADSVGFLAAYSGNSFGLAEDSDEWEKYFVPQIYTLPQNAIPSTAEESRRLQDYIFSQYEMLNANGERRNLLEIFKDTPLGYPPSGSGDCCAPKLLQYAFLHHLRPLCMAEFWWGESPKDEIRHHLNFYPSCMGRCKPILSWMLQGMAVDPNPMEMVNEELERQLEIVYEDEWLVIVNKPSGMLSVPGKISAPCVVDVLQKNRDNQKFCPVHRLDMFTSGLQILVKMSEGFSTSEVAEPMTDEKAYKDMQRMFESRQVKKCYVALLDGLVKDDRGEIRLPLSADYLDRPRQKVDFEHGKTAVTEYEVVERRDGRTLIKLYPHTGRTHQLRVHCASEHGLGCPIVGDELYGRKEKRLCLHAQSLSFVHPVTGKDVTVEAPPKSSPKGKDLYNLL